MNSDMASARPAGAGLLAGAVYFVLIFALGFALGFIRDIILRAGEPEGGRIIAVLIELPVMLLASWFACAFVIKRFAVPAAARERALIGLVAFGLLMLAELCLSLFLLGRTVAGHFQTYAELSYALGLAAQLGFAAFPLAQISVMPRTARSTGR